MLLTNRQTNATKKMTFCQGDNEVTELLICSNSKYLPFTTDEYSISVSVFGLLLFSLPHVVTDV